LYSLSFIDTVKIQSRAQACLGERGWQAAGFVQAGTNPVLKWQLLYHMNIFLFCGYVSNWKFYLCFLSCFGRYWQFVIFSEMHSETI